MSGAGNPSTAKLFAGKVSLWLFHGDNDSIVPSIFSEQFYRRLKRAHADVRFDLYRGVAHDCWNKAFAEPDIMPWLFAQKK
jgi:predicted peptidase